jgi:uncharacterized membrane protein
MQYQSDYDLALYYTYCCQWDKLLALMVNTKDEVFSKRIEHFLHAFKYERNLSVIDEKLKSMFQHIDHATKNEIISDETFLTSEI